MDAAEGFLEQADRSKFGPQSHDPPQHCDTGSHCGDSLPDVCAALVSAGSLQQAIELVCSSDSATSLPDIGWSLVGKVVAAFLAGDSARAASGTDPGAADGVDAERWSTFGALLKAVAERGSAKELVFALLEQIDSHPQSDGMLLAVLPALAVAMARLPAKRRSGMDVVQEVLYGRMAAVVVPAEYELCEQEKQENADAGNAAGPGGIGRGITSCPPAPELRLSPGAEECVAPVLRLVDGMAAFAESLLLLWPLALSSSTPATCGSGSGACLPAAIAVGDSSGGDLAIGCSDRAELSLLLVKLLGHPLSRLRCEGTVDACCLRLLRLLARLQPDFWRYWSDLGCAAWAESGSGSGSGTGPIVNDTGAALRADAIERLSPAAVGNFIYTVLGRGHCLDNVPCVLDAAHVFERCLQPICALLASGDTVELEKGVQLLQQLLAPVGSSLPDDLAEEHPDFAELLRAVAHYATTASVTRFRSEFQRLLPELVGKFASRGRYAVLRRLQHVAGCGRADAQPTAGAGMALAAYVLLLVKDQVHVHRDSSDPYFDHGVRTRRLVEPAFALPDGALTDLIEQFDRLMVGLNTAVYLLHRCRRRQPIESDKPQRQQEPAWPFVAAEIRETFLLPLDKCLTMSRVQYRAKLEGLRTAGCRPAGSGVVDGADVEVSVLGLPTPLRQDLTVKAQIDFLESALLRFNLLENVLQTALQLSS